MKALKVLSIVVAYQFAAGLTMMLFAAVYPKRPDMGASDMALAFAVSYGVPLIVFATIGSLRLRQREAAKITILDDETRKFKNDGSTEREQEVSEIVSAWAHKEIRVRFAYSGDAAVINATVDAMGAGTSLQCNVPRWVSAREQADVILNALPKQSQ